MSEVIKEVGKPLMSQALVEVLRLRGIDVEFNGGVIRGRFSWSDLLTTAKTLADLLLQLNAKYPKTPQSVKCLVTAYAMLKGASVEESVEDLKQLNYLIETDEGLRTNGEWRALLRRCLTR